MYPEDSVQSYTNRWWEIQGGATAVRGRLIKTFVPYPEQKPHRLIPLGRGEDATQHQRALVRIEPFRIGQPMSGPAGTLPVAALPLRPGESYFVQRGKVRPALIIAGPGDDVPRELTAGTARWLTAQTLLVAPYYGKDQDGTRGGWPQPLADRIRHAEYNRFIWDMLPIPGPSESILRLDHLFAIGVDSGCYEGTPHFLSDEARTLLEEWLAWLVTGSLGGFLRDIRTELLS